MQNLQKGRQITATFALLILVVTLDHWGGFLPEFLRSQFSALPGEDVTPALPSINFCGLASPLLQHALGLARSPAVCLLASQGRAPVIICVNLLFLWQKCGSRRRPADQHLHSRGGCLAVDGGRLLQVVPRHRERFFSSRCARAIQAFHCMTRER